MKQTILELVNRIKLFFKRKSKRQNFLEPGAVQRRNERIRELIEASSPKKCSICGKNSSEASVEYDPVNKKYYCAECWKEEEQK